METISITDRGTIHKCIDDTFIDAIEKIYALCSLKITHYGVSITHKNTGQLKKYKRGKILYNYLLNNELERISFFSVPDDFVTVAYDYLLSISINYKNNYIIATFNENIINHEYIEEIKIILDTFMEKPYIQEIYAMDKEETPLLYAKGIKKNFKTLNILSCQIVKEANYESSCTRKWL